MRQNKIYKTKAGRGERLYIKYNISLQPENNDYILEQQEKGKLITHTINRIIAEHAVLTSQPPEMAKYGLWSHDNNRWLEWYYSDEEAAISAEQCGRSGLNFNVCGVNNTDDKWLKEIEV